MRVTQLLKSITTDKPYIASSKTTIHFDPKKQNFFKEAAESLLLIHPQSKKNATAHNISIVYQGRGSKGCRCGQGCGGRGKRGGQGFYKYRYNNNNNNNNEKGKTGVSLRHYALEEYDEISTQQQSKLREWQSHEKELEK